jgi:putative ABC transport system permease protein
VKHEGNNDPHPPSYPDYQDYRKQNDSFQDIAGFFVGFVGLSAENRAERITVEFVTPNYFEMLGVQAAVGRVILPTEGEKPGADPVIVLGHSYWMKRFGGDRGVVNRVVRVNGQPFTVVGVVPESFRGTYAVAEFDAYLPLSMARMDSAYKESFERRDNHDLRTLARLKPGTSLRQAQAAMDVIAKRLEAQFPDTNKTVTAHVFPERLARPEPNAAEQNPLVASAFLFLTLLVLLVACVNVANLLLVRATLRQKEMAIRAALGAAPVRLVRQLLTESVILALAGGAAGIVLGLWVSRLLEQVRLPGDLPFKFEFGFDWRVFAYVAGVAFLAGIVVGVLPAWRASRADVNDALREGGRGNIAGRHRARNTLVVCQVAGSLVLLIAAGLFVRSLGNAQSVELGFDPRNVINFSMDPGLQGYDQARSKNFFREVEQRVRTLPGVEAASLAYCAPMGYYNMAEYVEAEGQEVTDQKRRPASSYNAIGTDYFKVMRIQLLRGRVFDEHDTETSPRVALINEFMANRFWSGQDPLGKRFRMMEAQGKPGPWMEVVGVVKNGKFRWIFEDPDMYFWVPLEQKFQNLRVLQARTSVPPETLAAPIQREIRALDAELPVYDVMTMERGLDGGNGFFLVRMGAIFAGALGTLGLALAVVGVYGVVSYAASQRTHEIGIRMALGAGRRDILKLIVGQGLGLVAIGVGLGLVAAFALAQAIANLLFGMSAHDPLTFGGVVFLLGLVALAACWIPARRASRVDPLVALRYE